MLSVFGSVKFADIPIFFLIFYTVAQLFKNLDCINYVSLVVMELNVLPVLVAASEYTTSGCNVTWQYLE